MKSWLQFSLTEIIGAVAVAAVFVSVARMLGWSGSILSDVVAFTAAGLVFHGWELWRAAKDENLL